MINAITKYAQKAKAKTRLLILPVFMALTVTGCGEVDQNDGNLNNAIPLPTDSSLNLYCADIGIAGETCILDDPDNPYSRTPFNLTQLFEELDVAAPSPKAKFYLWGTALARSPQGVYQFFTAVSLHLLYGESGSEIIREQALRAYQSLLDNYYDSAWYLKVATPDGDILFPVKLKDAVGLNLYDPTSPDALVGGLVPLFNTELLALQAMGEWGYAYNTDTKTVEVVK